MKIKYILGFFVMALIFNSCQAPLEDIYSSLDSLQTSDDEYMQNYIGKALAESTYTLIEDDYKLSSNDDVASYLSFSSSAPAEEHLAEILDQMFYATVASEMSVNYNYYLGLPSYLPTTTTSLYELDDDDYDGMGTGAGEPGEYNNFSTSALPGDYLPAFLLTTFDDADTDDLVHVTYDYYDGGSSTLTDLYKFDGTAWVIINTYEVTTADYDSWGNPGPGQYNNFSYDYPPENYLPDLMLVRFPAAIADDGVFITYKYYDGSTSTITDFYVFNGSAWAVVEVEPIANSFELSYDDYNSMGQTYGNFSSSANPDDYLPTFLSIKFPYANADDIKVPTYEYYVGSGITEIRMDEYKFDGSVWTKTLSTIEQTGLFSYDGANWNFIPPIKFIETTKAFTVEYTMVDADYELVGNGKYHNFDVRAGKDEETIEVRIEKLTVVIKANFEVAVGDVYSVTYDVYDGSNTTMTTVLEAVEDVK